MPCCVCAPGGFACYKTDGNLKELKKDNAYLNRLIDANIEGYQAIQNAGHEILPDADKEFEGAEYPVWQALEAECEDYLQGGEKP